ncbi:transporter substrate-binding domain-containing protein [Geobacter sulfurreducens]|uniref:histidine kinase n=1 Tax=Geobacter sulfurreducens (strain ATCC 51573 / DSM 12127 / PCA) TaxID=243231 RepID=Q749I7_GEOSL|nr:transporter substrate-binding domain-containing protein [Geobacter sulfurreducens]AAR36150.1 periplasmic substrate-binding histidine kinase [Geobacter sulfurreducens PCA]ADI85506.1 periplasmic substrate-binding histidine kinase [Geobacter sulfurreducens KN400]UAC03441.1 transporter substrate-binding domain-containing protein [Geobacter sulfurreducens]HCD94760.1 histidine kinase [Geobacter sulfurreducens]
MGGRFACMSCRWKIPPVPLPGRGYRYLAVLLTVLAALVLVAVGTASAADAPRDRHRTIVVGGDRDYPPYEFIDQNGKPAGYNVELTRAIAEVMGMTVEFRLGAWSEMFSALKSGRVDVLQGISWSEKRARQIDFTPPHTIVYHAIFARRDSPPAAGLEDLRGRKVALHRDGIMHEYLAERGYGKDLVLTPTPADALRLLAAGGCDYAVVAMVPGMYIIRENRLTNLVPVARSIAAQRYGYAVRQGDAELLARFSEGLAILRKTGQYEAIRAKWLGVLEPQPVRWQEIAKYAAVVVIPLLVILGGTVLWSHSLRRQVAQRTESLSRALEEVQLNQQQLLQADKMAALGILVSGVAHEINNPTGLILLDVPILRKIYNDAAPILEERYRTEGDFTLGGLRYSRVREEVPRLLDEMQDGAKRIKRIVEDLKDFARRDDVGGKELVDLNGVAQAAVRLVDASLRKATTRFTARYEPDLPRVLANVQRIEQVVVNLVLNACQALPDPSRGIELETSFDPAVGCVNLRVRDEGSGIAPENIPRLTDPFFTTKRESGGTGLGLSVSAGIIKEHGGALSFESALGEGTTVTLSLPVIA